LHVKGLVGQWLSLINACNRYIYLLYYRFRTLLKQSS
jgi:hypothetical protein